MKLSDMPKKGEAVKVWIPGTIELHKTSWGSRYYYFRPAGEDYPYDVDPEACEAYRHFILQSTHKVVKK